ncbi:MAG: alkaline phosphatase family protein [Candidatus Tumulicola sp.]
MRQLAALLIAASLTACSSPATQNALTPGILSGAAHSRGGSTPIQHVVVIMQENRSFDNLFHGFPGADTATSGPGHGTKYVLQQVPLTWTWDLRHDHTQFLEDYDQGKDDGFDAQISKFKSGPGCSDPINHPACWAIYNTQRFKTMAYSYVEQSKVQPYWTMATQYALGDHTFSSNSGPSFVSHQYLIAAQSGHSSEVPKGQPWGCDADPSVYVEVLKYGQANPPVFSKATGYEVPGPFPCFTYPTIAGLLDGAGITWRYYVEPPPNSGSNLSAFEAISQVFHGPDWANVVRPDTKVLDDIQAGQLQQVSWVMPSGKKSDHAGRDSGANGPDWVASIVNAIGESKYWNSTAIIIMWDEWGGWYDHVHPPQYPDPVTHAREGLGFRVPLIVVSPYAKAGYISHAQHEIASTVHYIEFIFGLGNLGLADTRADAFDDMFDYSQNPLHFQEIPTKLKAEDFIKHPDDTPADDY